MIDNQLLLALSAGFLISVVAGVLGCFVVWRRMAYFGDSMAHSALFGLAIGIFFDINSDLAMVLVAFAFAGLLFLLKRRDILPLDSLLGVLAHGSLALAMVLIGFSDNPDIDLESLLFGDILAVNLGQIYIISAAFCLILPILYCNWQKLVLFCINKELAMLKNYRLEMIFMLIFALMVAVSIKIVGALLITSILIIPAVIARRISSSVTQMVLNSVIICVLACSLGIVLAYNFGVLAAPIIVLSLIVVFAASHLR